MKHDPAKWSKENIIKVEKTLHKIYPLIQFYEIKLNVQIYLPMFIVIKTSYHEIYNSKLV